MNNDKIRFGPFELDPKAGELRHGGRRVRLQERPLKMLVALLATPGEVVTREEMLREVWGDHGEPTTRTVDNHLATLRAKLEPIPSEPRHFLTVHGVGYKFTQ